MREPLKPTDPPEVHTMVLPPTSVMLMMVLLKLAVMCACPWLMFLRSRRRTRFCCCSANFNPYFVTFFLPAIAIRRPLRVRAFV